MKNTIAKKITKEYCFNNISKNIKDINWVVNKKTLKNIREASLNLKKTVIY